MALHTDLDIHKAAMDLLRFAYTWSPQVPRALRRSLADKVVDECGTILLLIGRANEARGEAREFHLTCMREHLGAVIYSLRVAHDLRHLSNKAWSESILITDAIGKQISGWLKKTRGAPSQTAFAV